jgi:hypothetical protein
MGSLFFDNEARDKQTKQAIIGSTLQSFLEFYAGYLLDNRIVDNKDACFSNVGRLVSDSMDRGECSLSLMEHMKKYIQEYSIKTERVRSRDEFQALFTKVCYELSSNPSTDLSQDIVDKLAKYKQVCDEKRRLESEFAVDLKKPINDILSSYVGGHKSAISADFAFLS